MDLKKHIDREERLLGKGTKQNKGQIFKNPVARERRGFVCDI